MSSNLTGAAYTALTGFCMAAADSVPGVSGGTVVFVMGLYDRFISSLASLLHGSRDERRAALIFLLKLGIGWVVGMAGAVTLLSEVFVAGIYQVSSLFLGFVAASIPLIIFEEREALLGKWKYLPFALLGAARSSDFPAAIFRLMFAISVSRCRPHFTCSPPESSRYRRWCCPGYPARRC